MDICHYMNSARMLRFMSWNSNGLKQEREKRKSEVEKQNCDVVFLQETHSNESKVIEVLDGYKSFYTTQTSKRAGVAILIKTNMFTETKFTKKDPAGCYILVKCTLNEKLFTLMNVYNWPSDLKPLLKLRSVLQKHAEGILLIGGDFNVPLNPYLDRTSSTDNKSHTYFKAIMEELVTSFHLVDVWRRLNPEKRQYSYQQNDVQSRLDYFFVTEESMQYISKCDIPEVKSCSDHYPVVLEINMSVDTMNPDFCLDISKESNITIFQKSAVDKWLSSKEMCGVAFDFTVNPHRPLMISVGDVEWAIQTLIVNDVKRPDGLPVSFYKNCSYVLIPYLCAFYNNILIQPTNIPEWFNDRIEVSKKNCIFNVDYLILASIMAKWLYEDLQSHSTHCTDDDEQQTDEMKRVLITFKKHPKNVKVKWSFLKDILDEEKDKDKTNPPLLENGMVNVLYKILKSCPKDKYKLLQWGCPLTPVLITVCLKHIANENVHSGIHISRENVIVLFTKINDIHLLENLTEKYLVKCKILK